jgi:hypothetical protein
MATNTLNRNVAAVALVMLATLAVADAARYGWGGATIEGDRVKWGLQR